jgi:hypothetical protein
MSQGTFSGNPRTEWLVDKAGDDRDMQMLEDFYFVDPAGRKWLAPTGATVNGASIPAPLWSTVGSPYTGDYRRASIVHDVACADAGVSRKEADVMFFDACLAGGCSELRARILYAGVRTGAWASRSLLQHTISKERLFTARANLGVPSLEEDFLRGKLGDISEDITKLPPGASIADMDAVIERHLPV